MGREFEQTLEDIDRCCRANHVPYAIIGGIAGIIHGSTRTTVDIDLTILAEVDQLEFILQLFAEDYISLQPDPLNFFQRCLFISLQHRRTKLRVDIAAALSGFERQVIERRQRLIYNDVEVSTCTVEDLIIMKLVAARPKDDLDLENLISLHRKSLNLAYLHARAKEFIEVERSDVPERLEELLRSLK
jgi:hypothetical protein